MTPPSTTRRRLLAVVGAAALSGCAGLFGDEEDPAIDGTALQTLGPGPSVDRPLPVTLDDEHFTTARERAETLLSAVPEEFGPEEIPNEAVRSELAEVRDRAREELATAADASSTPDRLDQLRAGRGSAANAKAAWRSIDGELDRETVRERVDEIGTALSDFREVWSYLGDDPIRATVVHETVESFVGYADEGITDDVERNLERPENAVTIGLLAGELERARAALDDASGIYSAFETDVSGDASSTIESSADSLVSTLSDRQAGLPDGDPDEPSDFVEPDVSGTPAAWALDRLYWQCANLDWVHEAAETDRPATAILRTHARLARFEAFEAVRSRVNDGETFEVSSAEDVTRRRSAAVSAIEEALEASSYPLLARSELSRSAAAISYLDDRVRQVGDETSPASVHQEVAEYLMVEETANGVRSADVTVAGALDAAEDNP